MGDYNSLKVPDLKKLLQTRSLPVSGNKAELVARLQESDDSKANPDVDSKNDKEKESTGVTAPAGVEGASHAGGGESTSKDQVEEENNTKASAAVAEGESPAASGPATTGGEGGIAPPADDEIDWGEEGDGAGVAANKSTTGKGKETTRGVAEGGGGGGGGGQGRAPNPVAVPNQKLDFDPSKTHDLTVHRDNPVPTTTTNKETDPKPTEDTQTQPPAKSDFTAGLSNTNIDEEIARRKARAKRFQTQPKDNGPDSGGAKETSDAADPTSTEAIKALERAKRFGPVNGSGPNTTATDNNPIQIRGLDQALPERTRRKRGRDNNNQGEEDAGGVEKRRRHVRDGGRGGGRDRRGRGPGRGSREGGTGGRGESKTRKSTTTGGKITDDPVEKAKAEARAKKFAAKSS